jgi:hypothetical protein
MNRVHPTCTERQSLNKECGWKGGDRGGLAQWEQSGEKRNKEEERKNERKSLTLTGPLMEGIGSISCWDTLRLPNELELNGAKMVRVLSLARLLGLALRPSL